MDDAAEVSAAARRAMMRSPGDQSRRVGLVFSSVALLMLSGGAAACSSQDAGEAESSVVSSLAGDSDPGPETVESEDAASDPVETALGAACVAFVDHRTNPPAVDGGQSNFMSLDRLRYTTQDVRNVEAMIGLLSEWESTDPAAEEVLSRFADASGRIAEGLEEIPESTDEASIGSLVDEVRQSVDTGFFSDFVDDQYGSPDGAPVVLADAQTTLRSLGCTGAWNELFGL